ncbi:succinyl-diaminopimelate desuccinylase [Gammaproteobacteria bacterium AB-CW1]|uniref:Succinyl-diaminopimelate desuccinylase n=1 Tax=Natronospira elongata TaxID=3110268 RepID=A0AAP6JE15_9GAMM|nr:succinyl-diaminopimelate desuccinylase [Gammaproteobacteria bacterium AB-CW1]
MNQVNELAKALIRRRSITPEDAGCQALIAERLEALGFRCEALRFGEVDNLWAVRGEKSPLFCFAGHTDVVPTGPEDSWTHPPFEAVESDGWLWGRGAADMKGGLAAMICAVEDFLSQHPDPGLRLAFLITSDEEGPAQEGTKKVMETLKDRGVRIDYCVVGEPSSRERVGDVVRHGRRGSLSGQVTVSGIQGHVAYPQNADNPIPRLAAALSELSQRQWDEGDADFPPTSFQISNFNAGTGANNVIPATAEAWFNFRYSPRQTPEGLQQMVNEVLERHAPRHECFWRDSGRPFITRGGPLVEAVRDAVRDQAGLEPEFSTSGGTSDGRFIAPTGTQLVELGPTNATIHAVDERIRVDELDQLAGIYRDILERMAS